MYLSDLATVVWRNRTLKLMLFLFVLSLLTIAFFFLRLNQTVDSIIETKRLLASYQNSADQLEMVRAQYDQYYAEASQELNERFPYERNIIGILESLEEASLAADIQPQINLQARDETQPNLLTYRTFIDGDEENLLTFIDILESLPVVTEIKSISSEFTEDDDEGKLGEHQILFTTVIR